MPLPRLTRGLPRSAAEHVRRVERFGKKHLEGIARRTGESYWVHGCEVAGALRELTQDPQLLSAAILHDILVHPDGAELLSIAPLEPAEQTLVTRMRELRRLHIDERTKDLDTVLAAFSEDARLLPMRMAHRLNDVRNIHRFGPALRLRIARETLHMYTAIASRLGFHAWRTEMEDACFAIVHPRIAQELERTFRNAAAIDHACLRHTRKFLEQELRSAGIASDVQERIKGSYSTYRKMVLKKRGFHELTDRLAVRLIVPTVEDCYRALGVVHGAMHPIPGKLKDYIGAPKKNGYRSIHTVIYPLPGVTEQPMEIQIRTKEMHRECEFGIAAHGDYKHYLYALSSGTARVNLLRNLESLREEVRSPKQFETALRRYFREDHMAIFDHENQLYHLKKPATALDFACLAYGRRIAMLKEIRMNGRKQALATPLKDGDTVEARFGRKRMLEKSWRSHCLHARSVALLEEHAKE